MEKIREILAHSTIKEEITSIKPFGNGHIHDTYLIKTDKKDYILQKLNTTIFKNVEGLMKNIEVVTAYLKDQYRQMGKDVSRHVLNLVYFGHQSYYQYEEEIWRLYDYIENTISYDEPLTPKTIYQQGKVVGEFLALLDDFDASMLVETIPGFHDTPKRFKNFERVYQEDLYGQSYHVVGDIQFVLDRKEDVHYAYKLYEEGKIKLRVTHNDTKLNNVLMDSFSQEGLCLIDLDTVMPGFAMNDFGDALRTGASTASEDEKDLSKVSVSITAFDQFTSGYMSSCKHLLTKEEALSLLWGFKLITLEQGIRFLTDYLEGNVYYKVKYPEHNLDRARTQFALVKDIEKKWDVLLAILKRCYGVI